ncbi:hypothetical protein GMES_4435 [Paraglaciecola mesophila KMM 241]|uniref:Uncharacterized protein n=1 Tax=Paraglaciecola mesophila KMM 241 TaxID=1128912 RepID=K6YRU1_9ALTE|nr:hypothetical protein GMES_4435 [Paraglaciecola mesophila KMM 241]
MGVKIGWRAAFLGYFFRLLERSDWLTMDGLSYPAWMLVHEVLTMCAAHKYAKRMP